MVVGRQFTLLELLFDLDMSLNYLKQQPPVDQVDAHLTGIWAALKSLLELLLDLSKSLNCFYMGRSVMAALDSLKVQDWDRNPAPLPLQVQFGRVSS